MVQRRKFADWRRPRKHGYSGLKTELKVRSEAGDMPSVT